jgi:progressive ankylosis protein
MRQRDIFWFWLPLFASWLLMTAEGPIISAAINRLPNQVIMLAAQGIVISLSVTIESPIINLLATSTALVKDHASYRLVRRFTIHWMIALTLVTVLVAFTPLFDVVVRQWLDVPEPVAVWVQPGMQIMTLWSAAIAWRRFLQGLLIRFNRPRQMAWGTAVRLLSSGGTVIGLAIWTDWPGVINGATALMVGVIAEAIYATIAVQPILREELSAERPQTSNLTYSHLFWFHLPLAATSLLVLLAQPLVTFSLARLDQPTESLAAWPVLFQIMLMARAAALALPEVVIALSRGPQTFIPIRRFSLWLTGALTLFIALFIFTPLSNFYVFTVQEMTPVTGQLTISGLLLFLPYPALATITSWLRGLLINEEATKAVNMGMAINLLCTAVVLTIGLQQLWPGLPTAAAALNIAAFGEIIYLTWRTQRALPHGLSLWGSPQPAVQEATSAL